MIDMQPILELLHISKIYPGSRRKAVDNVSLKVEKGEILALVGESGSGKTTLLRTIAGLEHPDKGSLTLSGHIISEGKKAVPPHQRNIGMVFQDYALFPHMTIAENVGFGLRGKSKEEKKAIIEETLALTGLNESLSKYPHQLSGGQQQRVALARALAPKPSILLLDEPFSNLDTILHDQIREDLRKIVKATGITTILVTHHTRDALCMADKVAVLSDGVLLQTDTPSTIYSSPKSGYVANLFGKYSCLSFHQQSGRIATAFGTLVLDGLEKQTGCSYLFIRPEQVKLVDPPSNGDSINVLAGVVDSSAFLGDHIRVTIKPESEESSERLVMHSDTIYPPGTRLHFYINELKAVDFGNLENE
jgi:iron(III) transport system ATP-binding protein